MVQKLEPDQNSRQGAIPNRSRTATNVYSDALMLFTGEPKPEQ
jgi:hypothetical protein